MQHSVEGVCELWFLGGNNGALLVPAALSRHVWMRLHFQEKMWELRTGISSLPKLLSLKAAHESRARGRS